MSEQSNNGITRVSVSHRRFIVANVPDTLSPRYRSLPDRHLQLASNPSHVFGTTKVDAYVGPVKL